MRMFMGAALVACTALAAIGATPARAADVTVEYWMWDGNQAPIYRQCADRFESDNPGIKIHITQDNWDNYWTTLNTAFVAGTAPDVFVNHITRLPEFLVNNVLADMTPRIAADTYDMASYLPGLAENWSKDGHQWGLPKDWDTIALVYNKAMLSKAGVSEEEIRNLDWNPENGGSFSKVVARLTVDRNGKHGDEPGFDKSKVAVYGWATDPVDGYGQNQWSFLAASAGFKYVDKQWGTTYDYDSPALVKTLTWLHDLASQRGLSISQENLGNLKAVALFSAGKVALVPDGSWMIAAYRDNARSDFGFAPVPKGPDGRRSMFNGLADSIWSGSKHKDEAWRWAKYLGGSACQTLVGASGVVFPARPEADRTAEAAYRAKGLDVSAFTLVATPATTFPFPITDHSSEISAILKTAVENVMLGQGKPAQVLKDADDQVNGMF